MGCILIFLFIRGKEKKGGGKKGEKKRKARGNEQRKSTPQDSRGNSASF